MITAKRLEALIFLAQLEASYKKYCHDCNAAAWERHRKGCQRIAAIRLLRRAGLL